MNKIDEIKEELIDLEQALEHLEKAIDAYESIDWPDCIQMPHHAMMEMYEAHKQMEDRKQEIEDKLERI
jgi:DNA repair exonuclease SbcCD ATPase subunit